MKEPITKERWEQAQKGERMMHLMTKEDGLIHYSKSYGWNFHYLGINQNQDGKTIVEIGCADFPALHFCINFTGVVIEPMQSKILEEICQEDGIKLIKESVEDTKIPDCDEIWIFNVMQHIIDPDLFVEKCKAAAKVIRYFEPVDYPVSIYHPHSFTKDDFIGYFGEAVVYNDSHPAFHDGNCVYGIWKK